MDGFAIADRNDLPRNLTVREPLIFELRYNITPSQPVPVIRQQPDGENVTLLAVWELIPSGVTDSAELSHLINAKAETVAIKSMFRHAFELPMLGLNGRWWAESTRSSIWCLTAVGRYH